MNKILLATVFSILTLHVMAQEKIVQTAGRTQLGEFAPKFAELNDDVLFGEVWSRTDRLGLRDRSLVTITSLISQGITDNSLVYHLQAAKKNGITRTEIAEIITHIGFYAGWPKAWAAFNLAKGVWAEDSAGEDAKAAFQREMIFPIGEPNTAYAQYFIGNSYLAPVSREQVNISNVTFEPRCRNNWHIHKAAKGGGQMLIGVAGRQAGGRNSARYGNPYSGQRETLARSGGRQLVRSSGVRGSGGKCLQRVARTGDGRGVRPT